MKIILSAIKNDRTVNIATRCPHYGHFGAFIPVAGNDIRTYHHEHNRGEVTGNFLGIRKCPNENVKDIFFLSLTNTEVYF